MSGFNIVASLKDATVVAEYHHDPTRPEGYQSEADLERAFIRQLERQGYEYLYLHNEASLVRNLRAQLETLNGIAFTDAEWERFFREHIAGKNEGVVEKTRRIQDDPVQVLRRDDGTNRNITLIDKKNVHNNSLQVLNQYETAEGAHANRYDVTLLVNGLPLVHVELKRRGVAVREAFNQIRRYSRDSFWAGSGLFEYVQIFIISNGTHTKYYSNTTRDSHVREQGAGERQRSRKTSNSFEFTSFWADGNNRVIPDLEDFTQTFLTKRTLLKVLTRYCVLTAEGLLLVMRPYQIAAAERILSRIEVAGNYRKEGTIDAGGYIWHTTGSGKTLTSFKAAQLATALTGVEKVLFVVDRKDLDYQTMREYDRFQKGAANSNTSTRVLQKQLEDPQARIIITTIQKLDRFIAKNRAHEVYGRRVVIIFDECHRSQFGGMHAKIVKAFRRYHLFGFTGTPIFAANAARGMNPVLSTTEQAFGEKLHTYTIVDAINDGNVLPFRIDYVNTIRMAPDVQDKKVPAIDVERALAAPERVREVSAYILDHFDQKTMRSSFYALRGQRVAGFNALFAVGSIQMARQYYAEIKRQLRERGREMAVATIFSYSPNESDPEDGLPDENFDTGALDQSSREFLEGAIADYNRDFSTNYDTSGDKFENYYKDLSLRVKNREVDLLIVVNMFLTGFDATTLNTLWVDRNLRQHGLIQAFSRTNRILNSVKTFGNIVCFRDLQKETDDAIALFGNKDAGGIVLLKDFQSYYEGYEEDGRHHPGYVELIAELREKYPLDEPILGETDEKDFIRLYGAILRLKNILNAFDDFEGREILTERDTQDYQSVYIDLYDKYRREKVDRENINEDIVFEMELIRQVEINIDYILMLVAKYQKGNMQDKAILVSINRAIASTIQLRSKKELIERFISTLNASTEVEEDWKRFVREQKETELETIIQDERLKPEQAKRYLDNAFRDGTLKTTGTDFDSLLPPVSRFGGNRAEKKLGVIERLMRFFEKYFGLV